MKSQDVVGGLRQIADELPGEPGLSIAECEFWWDTMDRWAEDLVDPACSGTCQCSGSPGSLPPAIVLEVLKILEGEVNLREETRVAEQARPALAEDEYGERAGGLSKTQGGLEQRVKDVTGRDPRIARSRGGSSAAKSACLARLPRSWTTRTQILARPETGPPAIGAETEAIELLLQSRRINPRGGGGGGSDARRWRRRKHRRFRAGAVGDRRQRQGGAATRARQRKPSALRAGRCPRSSAPAWTNTSAGWKIGSRRKWFVSEIMSQFQGQAVGWAEPASPTIFLLLCCCAWG